MTEFFKSAQVRAALAELAEIQDDLAHTMSSPRILSDDEKKDYVRKLKLFLEKQKLFFFRVSLSDDPEAVQVKEHILDTAQMFGFKEMTGMDKFFQQLDDTIKKVVKDLDEDTGKANDAREANIPLMLPEEFKIVNSLM